MRKLAPHEIARLSPEDNALLPRSPLGVIVENVRSAHNVGAILRTADAVRAAFVFTCGYTPSPDHRAVNKSALGAQDSVPWQTFQNAAAAMAAARERGFGVAALEITDQSGPISALAPEAFPLCLVLGNEVTGVESDTLAACDLALELPQFGTKHSLNVSVAFGAAAYLLLDRQRDF